RDVSVVDLIPLLIVSVLVIAAAVLRPALREVAAWFVVVAVLWAVSHVVQAAWYRRGGPELAGVMGLAAGVVAGVGVPGVNTPVMRGLRRGFATGAVVLLFLAVGAIPVGPWWIPGIGVAALAVFIAGA